MLPMTDGRAALLREDAGASATESREGGMLHEYAMEFNRLRGLAVSHLQAMRNGGSSSFDDEAKAAGKCIDEMEQNRRQVQSQFRMEITVASQRQEWDQRLRDWQREVADLRRQLGSAREEESRRSLGLGGGGGAFGESNFNASSHERQAVSQSTELLARCSQQLEEAKRQALESESVGEGVLGDLAAQRETILHVRENMRTVGAELTSARQALGRMVAFAQRNRMTTFAVVLVLSLALYFWGLSVLRLELKYTLMLSVMALVLSFGSCVIYRRRCKGNG